VKGNFFALNQDCSGGYSVLPNFLSILQKKKSKLEEEKS